MLRNLLLILLIYPSLISGQTNNFERAQNLFNQGKINEALKQANVEIGKLKVSDTMFVAFVKLRVTCNMYLSQYNLALEDYRTILNLDSNDIFSCVGISYAYWMLHEMELCFKYLDRAYIIDPKNILTLNNLSYFHGQAGNYDTGLKYANEGLALDSLTNDLKATLLNNRGYAYIGLKNYDKALEDINNSILLFPENSFAFYNRALANIGLNKTDNVCSDLKKSKKLGGNFIPKELNEKYCKN